MSNQRFWQRIRTLFRQPSKHPTITHKTPRLQPIRQAPPARQPVPSQQPVTVPPVAPQEGPRDYATTMMMIHQAGRELRMIQITYDGVTRLVEPYSMRERGTGRLFFGWCSIHDRIHSFRVERITHIEITNQHYAPRFTVEF